MLSRTQYIVTQSGISEVVICRCVMSGIWRGCEKTGGVKALVIACACLVASGICSLCCRGLFRWLSEVVWLTGVIRRVCRACWSVY